MSERLWQLWRRQDELLVNLLAYSLDALMEEGVSITPEQYRNALLKAAQTMTSENAPHQFPQVVEGVAKEFAAQREQFFRQRLSD